MAFDIQLFQFIHNLSGISSLADWFAIAIAEYIPYLVGFFVWYLILKEHQWKRKIWAYLVLGFSLLLSRGIIVEIIHYFYNRPRPFLELGFTPMFMEASSAFPSSHALVLTTLAFLAFRLNKKAGYWLFAFAIVNGISRIYAGVHWPTDVIGGLLLAIVTFWIAEVVFPERMFSSPLPTSESQHHEENITI